MADKLIKIKRGLKNNIPNNIANGEPIWTTDTKEMFVGDGHGRCDPACKGEQLGFVTFDVTSPLAINHGEDLKLVRRNYKGGIIEVITDETGEKYRFTQSGHYLIIFDCCPAVITTGRAGAEASFELRMASDHFWDLGSAYCETIADDTGNPKGVLFTSQIIRIDSGMLNENIVIKNTSGNKIKLRNRSNGNPTSRLTIVRVNYTQR